MKHHYLTPAALAIAILLGACASAPTSTSLLEVPVAITLKPSETLM